MFLRVHDGYDGRPRIIPVSNESLKEIEPFTGTNTHIKSVISVWTPRKMEGVPTQALPEYVKLREVVQTIPEIQKYFVEETVDELCDQLVTLKIMAPFENRDE